MLFSYLDNLIHIIYCDNMNKRKIIINILWLIIWSIMIILIVYSKTNKDTILVINNANISSTIVYRVNDDKILYQNNIHQKMLPASLTKILTALVAYKYLDINQIVRINDEMINVVGSRIYLEKDDLIKVEDLLYGMILQSGNDAAKALQYAYSNNPLDFISKMNEEVINLGLENSKFENTTGLDEKEYNYTTTYDFAIITKELLKYDYLKTLIGIKKHHILMDNKKITVTHKHKLLYNDNFMIGGKTGYTKKAGRTLVSIYEKGEEQIIIVTFNVSNDWNVHRNLATKFL